MPGLSRMTWTAPNTHAHGHSQINGEGALQDQIATEGIIRNHCPRPNPLPKKSTQAPRRPRTLGDRRRAATQQGPEVCVPGGRPRGPMAEMSDSPQPPAPTPLSSQPSPTAGPVQMWILTTSCRSRGGLRGDELKSTQGCMAGRQPPVSTQTWCHCLGGPSLSSIFFIPPDPALWPHPRDPV